MMRLHKYMAQCQVGARRKCEAIIRQGRVKVNDQVITELGFQIEPEKDVVKVDDQVIRINEEKIYVMLNKPKGYVVTASDELGRKTVFDLLRPIQQRLFPVGRLDLNSEGLLLLTNDGQLAYFLISAKSRVEKEYIVEVKGRPNEAALKKLRKGIEIEKGVVTAPARIELINHNSAHSRLRVIIYEGKKRQIRRMFDQSGHKVIGLKRVRIGPINLGRLTPGRWRYLTSAEVKKLKKQNSNTWQGLSIPINNRL